MKHMRIALSFHHCEGLVVWYGLFWARQHGVKRAKLCKQQQYGMELESVHTAQHVPSCSNVAMAVCHTDCASHR